MAKHNELGKAGENAAVTYLEQQGYIIRDRNWRKGHFELDIVATQKQELIVVEVKTRSNTQFAEPEDAVDIPKIKRTVRATDTYMSDDPTSENVQPYQTVQERGQSYQHYQL